MVSTASALISELERRARDDTEFERVLTALLDAPVHTAGGYARIAAHELNDRRMAEAVASFKDAALPTAAVQDMLGLQTPQAVHRLHSRGRIIGQQLGNATWFPAWQFAGGRLRADLPRLLEVLRAFSTDVIALDRVMRLERDELAGASIADALDLPATAPTAWVVLEQLAD